MDTVNEQVGQLIQLWGLQHNFFSCFFSVKCLFKLQLFLQLLNFTVAVVSQGGVVSFEIASDFFLALSSIDKIQNVLLKHWGLVLLNLVLLNLIVNFDANWVNIILF